LIESSIVSSVVKEILKRTLEAITEKDQELSLVTSNKEAKVMTVMISDKESRNVRRFWLHQSLESDPNSSISQPIKIPTIVVNKLNEQKL
jgi:hypothetical protein